MELTNAILAGEHRCGKRVSLRTIRWDHSDELCVGKLAGIRYRNPRLRRHATQHRLRFRYRFSCGWGSGSEGQAGLLCPIAVFEIFAAQDDEGGLGPRQMLPDPLSRRD